VKKHVFYLTENKPFSLSSPQWGEDKGEGGSFNIISTLTPTLSRWRERELSLSGRMG
jgi:hypothetical protein